jgi:hypothetical protein
MTAAWAGLGVVMGAGLGIESGSVVGTIACLIAGLIEMAALGAIFSLIGGRPGESLLGGGCGMAVGAVAELAGGQSSVVLAADFGLVAGALAGATLRPYLRLLSLPVLLVGRVLASPHRRRTVEAPRVAGRLDDQPLIPITSRRRPATSFRVSAESAPSRSDRESLSATAATR